MALPGRDCFVRGFCPGEGIPEDWMKNFGMVALVAFAALLVAGAPLMAKIDDPAATGKVTAYEAGKTISVQVGDNQKEFKIDGETKIEGEVAIGKEVQVWVKDGVATKIAEKK
jgi:hypothetical protein